MNAAHADDQQHPEHGSTRTRAPGARSARLALAVGLALTTIAAGLTVALAGTASASTLNGIATIASPGTTTPLTSGGSATPFTVSLPALAACTGDSAHSGYHVFSYLVPQATAPSSVTFTNHPSTGYGLYESNGKYYGPVNTASSTGEVIGVPSNFEWAPLVTGAGVSLTTLLYTGAGPTASGVWEAGLACANSSGVLTDNWNTEVTFSANASDANGFVWSAVPGPSGSSPAAISSASSTSDLVGSPLSFAPTATGSPVPVITESGTLPAGVTFTGGQLTGTPTVDGHFSITFTATNGILSPATQQFSLAVDQAPAITSASSYTFTQGAAPSFTVTASGYPAPSFTDGSGSLDGLTLNAVTGALSGTPTAAGTFTSTVTASNGISPNATQGFTLTVDASPVITSPTSYTFDQSAAPDFTVTASAFPAATFSDSGNLDGLSIDPNSGILSGTPTAAGTFTSTITASNGISPNATQDFTLNVDASPVITSPTSYTFDQSAAPDFTVTASGYPAPTFSDTGGLDGLSIDPDSGVLSGTPTSTGTFTTTITATNGVSPDATQSFTLVVNTAPQFTSPNSYTFTTGTAPDFTVTAAGNPAPTFGDTGGLDGLSIDPESGVLSGTPTTTGTFSTTITATNGISPDATQTFTVNVDAPPAITSAPSYTLRQGGPAPDFTVTASGYPAPTYTDGSGSLDGLALNPTTGVLSGTPTTTGTFTSTITASNGAGSPATQAFTLEVVAIPVISSPSSYTFTTGSAPVFTVTASGYPAPTYTDGSGSLDGLALNATTGVLSGTPTATGTFTSTITAGNGIGTAATQEFTLTVLGFHITTPAVLPSVAPGDTDPVAFATAGSGAGATFKWKGSGFPKGLKLSAGGTLAGTVSTKVAKGAVYHPTVTVTETVITKNGKKKVKTPTTVSATFTLTIS